MNSARIIGGEGPARRIFRFGQKLTGEQVPTVPARFRSGPGTPSGRLLAIRLRPTTGDGWLRLRSSKMPGRRLIRTIPLSETQPPAPTPDSLELRGGASVRCHDGYIGRLHGVTYDARSGSVLDLLVRVRGNVLADVSNSRDPLAALLAVSGQEVLLAPAWAISTTHMPGPLPFLPDTIVLLLQASAEQVASAAVVRGDGQLVHDIWRNWNENPAIAPYAGRLDVSAHDGTVTLRGFLPSPRQRATAELDAWHVPGILAIQNQIEVRR
ncbi:MAG: BON domain-containing protein [Ktedonobacterales bacterium]|nr:BON domain-containing protein [Ktedonobacterales bacterium]